MQIVKQLHVYGIVSTIVFSKKYSSIPQKQTYVFLSNMLNILIW